MASKQKRQESSERFYVEAFLKMNHLPFQIEEDRKEPRIPDFVLRTPEDTIGLEVTYLLKDEDAGGSSHRKREGVTERFMRSLCSTYYTQGGKPATVSALLPRGKPADSWLPIIAKRLRMARPETLWAKRRFQIDLGHGTIATFYVTSLPQEAGNYTWWKCVSNHVGFVRPATAEILADKIAKKAEKLARYAKAAERTILLIVAKRTRNSGMFHYTRKTMLPNQGFSEVHLLIYPENCYRVA